MNFIDHGYAVLVRHEDGTNTIAIATGMDDGEPTNVIARHGGLTDVDIRVDPDITLRRSGSRRYTTVPVEVAPEGGKLRVRSLRRHGGLGV